MNAVRTRYRAGGAIAFTTLERALEFLISWAGEDTAPVFQVERYIRLVTGECPHEHRTPEAAQACADRLDRAVKRGHGKNAYGDRYVMTEHSTSEGLVGRHLLSRAWACDSCTREVGA